MDEGETFWNIARYIQNLFWPGGREVLDACIVEFMRNVENLTDDVHLDLPEVRTRSLLDTVDETR